jgi:hypothetical protein
MLEAFDFTAPPREPVLLTTVRNPEPPRRVHGVFVYAGYGAAVLAVAGLIALPTGLAYRRRAKDRSA